MDTTYQEWSFDTNDNPAVPEVMDNEFGSAYAHIAIGDYASGWIEQLPGFGSMAGYWDLGGTGGQIVLDIDNVPNLTIYKEVWIQITYFQDIHQAPIVDVPGAQYITGDKILIQHVDTGGDWFLDQSIWRIEPTKLDETISIFSNSTWGTLIDQIVVDTKAFGCVIAYDDLLYFSAQWLQQGPDIEADLDGDADVDFEDFAVLADLWMEMCPHDWPWFLE